MEAILCKFCTSRARCGYTIVCARYGTQYLLHAAFNPHHIFSSLYKIYGVIWMHFVEHASYAYCGDASVQLVCNMCKLQLSCLLYIMFGTHPNVLQNAQHDLLVFIMCSINSIKPRLYTAACYAIFVSRYTLFAHYTKNTLQPNLVFYSTSYIHTLNHILFLKQISYFVCCTLPLI